MIDSSTLSLFSFQRAFVSRGINRGIPYYQIEANKSRGFSLPLHLFNLATHCLAGRFIIYHITFYKSSAISI